MSKARGKKIAGGEASQAGQTDGGRLSGGLWRRLLARRTVVAWLLFVALMVLYHANGDFLPANDATPNMFLSASLLKEGNLSFTPTEMPSMFTWTAETAQGPAKVRFDRWDDKFRGVTYTHLYKAGALKVEEPRYYIVPSIRTTANGERIYVNSFGIGAGLSALPVMAVLYLATGDLAAHPVAACYGAKFAASVMVAGSAAFIFLTAAGLTTIRRAALIAIAYGAGTCVWSTSSQALWQHGPNELFLAMGTYFLARLAKGGDWRQAAYAGLAYSAAVACRPTSIIVVAAVGAYLLIANRKALLPYVLACLPIGGALAAYNTYYLGAPYEFGQAKVGKRVAMDKTGSEALWQTPLWLGAAGLMVSPARGLLVYSPFMVFAFGGLYLAWRRRQYAFLRPLTVAMAVLLVIAFKWFDWWGGWCFGYRPIVDTMPIFAVLLVPVIDWICARKAVLAIFLVLVAWSFGVQVIGAWAFDQSGWNCRPGYEVFLKGNPSPVIVSTIVEVNRIAASNPVQEAYKIGMDVDQPEFRYRIWSITDDPILYCVENFQAERQAKHQGMGR